MCGGLRTGVRHRSRNGPMSYSPSTPVQWSWRRTSVTVFLGIAVPLGPNVRVDRATALPSRFAGPMMMRNAPPVAPIQLFVMWRHSLESIFTKDLFLLFSHFNFTISNSYKRTDTLRSSPLELLISTRISLRPVSKKPDGILYRLNISYQCRPTSR